MVLTGQGGYALLQLGRVCKELFPILASRHPDNVGFQALSSVGEALFAHGIVIGMLLFGFGLWWLFMAVASISTHWIKERAKFNLGFWAFTVSSATRCPLLFA